MNDQIKTEQPNEAHISPSELNDGLAIDRTGYCAWCKHSPDGLITIAAQDKNSKCCGCWFSEEKPNWE